MNEVIEKLYWRITLDSYHLYVVCHCNPDNKLTETKLNLDLLSKYVQGVPSKLSDSSLFQLEPVRCKKREKIVPDQL